MSSTVPSTHLPFEIVEKILVRLTRNLTRAQETHNPDLLACSLVSRAWVAPVRKLMWNLVYFVAPSTEECYKEFMTLYTSEHCILQLDGIEYLLVTDPQSDIFFTFLGAFQARLPRVRNIRIKSSSEAPSTTIFGPERLIAALDLWSIRTLELHGTAFHSIDDFLALFSSLHSLEYLSCHDIRLKADRDRDQNRTSTASCIHTLQVDVTLFFTLFSHVTLSNLNELILEDDPVTPWETPPKWTYIRDILSLTKNIERLTLRLFRPYATYSLNFCHLAAKILDLPKHTPKLRELRLYMGGPSRSFEDYSTFTYHMLSFPKPHPILSILRLPVLPNKKITRFDRLLQDCMPNLQALKFATKLPGESIQDALGDAKHIDMEELEEASVCDPRLRPVWDRGKAFLDGLEESMPFCAAKKCLFPTFVADEEGIEALVSQ